MGKWKTFKVLIVAALTAIPIANAGSAAAAETSPKGADSVSTKGPTDSDRIAPKEQRIILKVGGLTCSSCERQAGKALKKVRGVKEAIVSAKEGRAEITYDPDSAKAQDLVDAVRDAGYKAFLADSSSGG